MASPHSSLQSRPTGHLLRHLHSPSSGTPSPTHSAPIQSFLHSIYNHLKSADIFFPMKQSSTCQTLLCILITWDSCSNPAWTGAWGSILLTNSKVILMLRVHRPHPEKQGSKGCKLNDRRDTSVYSPSAWYVKDTQKYLLNEQKKLQLRLGGWNLLKSLQACWNCLGITRVRTA